MSRMPVTYRRRLQGKTDYRLRTRLLKSAAPRLVIRKSTGNITCQIIEHKSGTDKTVVSSDSKGLKKIGWTVGTGNLPAAYLTGYKCAIAARKKHVSNAIADFGLQSNTKGSRLYAALKGAIDGGLKVPHSPDIFPSPERIQGKHIKDTIPSLFDQAKARIK